jgi:hypothetical protein
MSCGTIREGVIDGLKAARRLGVRQRWGGEMAEGCSRSWGSAHVRTTQRPLPRHADADMPFYKARKKHRQSPRQIQGIICRSRHALRYSIWVPLFCANLGLQRGLRCSVAATITNNLKSAGASSCERNPKFLLMLAQGSGDNVFVAGGLGGVARDAC